MNKRRYLIIVGIVVAAVLLLATSCTTPTNRQPIIISLEAESEKVIPLGNCQIMCNATDPDGDELSYNWSASGGGITGEGTAVTWIAPDAVGFYDVIVTVTDGRGGKDTDKVTIEVGVNNPPTINSLVADADWTLPSSSLQVTCTASDPDGDELSYEWTASGGNISSTGAVVTWTAPQEVGVYNITVVVKDGYGGSATKTLPISVVTVQPPNIESLLVTKDRYGHCYLLVYSWGYKVGKGQKYDIECIASNTSGELAYEWSCTGGSISGEGSMITWTAPNTSIDVTVSVIVSDIVGNEVSKSVLLKVVACSSCTFGC